MRLLKKQVLCPRCAAPMKYTVESEKYNNGLRRISSYYRCPVCGYKLQDQYIQVNKTNGSIIISVKTILTHNRRFTKQ